MNNVNEIDIKNCVYLFCNGVINIKKLVQKNQESWKTIQ